MSTLLSSVKLITAESVVIHIRIGKRFEIDCLNSLLSYNLLLEYSPIIISLNLFFQCIPVKNDHLFKCGDIVTQTPTSQTDNIVTQTEIIVTQTDSTAETEAPTDHYETSTKKEEESKDDKTKKSSLLLIIVLAIII